MRKELEYLTTRYYKDTVSGPYIQRATVALASNPVVLAEFTEGNMDEQCDEFILKHSLTIGNYDVFTTIVDVFPPVSTD